MNCFTLEASFHGFFNSERVTTDFNVEHFLSVGEVLANSLFEYVIMIEDDPKNVKAR